MDNWNPINLDLIGQPLNWLLVAFVFILMCVVADAIMRALPSTGDN